MSPECRFGAWRGSQGVSAFWQRGIPESSIWRHVNRERSGVDAGSVDAALADFRSEVRPIAAALVLS